MNQGNLNVNQNSEVNNSQSNSANTISNVQQDNLVQKTIQVPQENEVKNVSSIPVANNVNTQVPNNENIVVAPTQTIINTGNKKTISIVWFLLIISMGVFIYYIDDILAYFNQSFTPVIKEDTSESGSANLVDGYIKVNTTNSYIKLKSIRFNNVKKGNNNAIFISYVSDKNYSASLPLSIVIELYNQNKEKIYEEDFNVFGSIESGKSRQYKILLEEKIYNDVYYCLIKTK